MESEAVKVYVRVRPFNKREEGESQVSVVSMSSTHKTVTLRGLEARERGAMQTFQYDDVLWSLSTVDSDGAAPATQRDVYERMGKPLLDHAFHGLNSCLLAYGQTGSGKTYTMMGGPCSPDDDGVIKRICKDMFDVRRAQESSTSKWHIEVGYVEIYNEKVSDLLSKCHGHGGRQGGRGDDGAAYVEVREHPTRGVFLEGQELREVNSPEDVEGAIESGNQQRHTAATKMNQHSSRSHAIVQLYFREDRSIAGQSMITVGKTSRMSLVDLAGSERVAQSQVQGVHFDEARFINLSLTTLGRVIDVLADRSKRGGGVPPYRESKLTYILRDSLGGNSKTNMVATVSPSTMNYDETGSTLRYAARAREVVNVARVNEDPRARRIRELEEQMAAMRHDLRRSGADAGYVADLEAKLQLLESEAAQRAADLRAFQLEKERSSMQERMLQASEAEKADLRQQADELERQMRASRAEAEHYARELPRLREENERIQAELRLQVAQRDAEVNAMRTQLLELEGGKQRLQATMEELDAERRIKEEVMQRIEQQQQDLQETLKRTVQSEQEGAQLQQKNDELAKQLRELQNESSANRRLRDNLESIKKDSVDLQNTITKAQARLHLTEILLEEATARFHEMSSHYHIYTTTAGTAFQQIIQRLLDEMNMNIDEIQQEAQHRHTNDLDQLTTAQISIQQLTEQYNAILQEKTDSEKQIITFKTQIDDIQRENQEHHRSLQQHIKTLTIEHGTTVADLQQQLQALGADRDTAVADLQQQLTAVTTNRDATVADLRQQVVDLSSGRDVIVDEFRSRCESLNVELVDVREVFRLQSRELKGEISRLLCVVADCERRIADERFLSSCHAKRVSILRGLLQSAARSETSASSEDIDGKFALSDFPTTAKLLGERRGTK